MSLTDPEIETYIALHTDKEPEVLKKLTRDTHANVLMPRMLSGHVQGRLLSMLSHMIKPSKILEIGTFTGYSAICLAEGLQDNGILHTIDINEELQDMVTGYIREAGMQHKIIQHIGNALEIIPAFPDHFDLVFIDADKINYLNYFNLVKAKLNRGGVIIADNVLWSGKVTGPEEKMNKDTKAIIDFNKAVAEDKDFQKIILPVRDGLMLLRKL